MPAPYDQITLRTPNTDGIINGFVMVFALFLHTRQFEMHLKPDDLHCPLLKQCTLTNYCIQHILYRDTAPVHATNFVTGELTVPSFLFVPRLLQRSILFTTRRQKHMPYPSCTGTTHWLKNLLVAGCCVG